MHWLEEKYVKLKTLHLSNFVFWVLGKFLFGLGLGILLPVYFWSSGWLIAGWMLIAFALILQIPAAIAVFHKKEKLK